MDRSDRSTDPERPSPKRSPRIRVRDILLALAITIPLAGVAVWLSTPVDEPAPTTASASASAPASVAVSVPPTVTLADPSRCTAGTCHVLRPVQVRKNDGGEASIQRGQTVTDVTAVTEMGGDGKSRVVLDLTLDGARVRAYAIDPNDGGPVFAAGPGK
jgi:hypothetical protein